MMEGCKSSIQSLKKILSNKCFLLLLGGTTLKRVGTYLNIVGL
jgi:hypothetical protein